MQQQTCLGVNLRNHATRCEDGLAVEYVGHMSVCVSFNRCSHAWPDPILRYCVVARTCYAIATMEKVWPRKITTDEEL